MTIKNFLYGLSCLLYTLVMGAAVYEHTAVWPNAFVAIPASLSMFQGEYGLESAPFWMNIHPVTILALVATLVVSWKTARKKHVLFTLLAYIFVMVVTFTYFVPELLDLINTPFSTEINQELTQRGTRWVNLSLVRLSFMVIVAVYLYAGAFKSGEKLQ